MKKILLSFLIFVLFLSLAGETMALRAKGPPLNLCLHDVNHDLHIPLLNKPMGNISLLDGPKKFYSVIGAWIEPGGNNFPLTGSGYVEGNVFHFTLASTYSAPGTYSFGAEVFWDLEAHTGDMYGLFSDGSEIHYTFEQGSCTEQDIVY